MRPTKLALIASLFAACTDATTPPEAPYDAQLDALVAEDAPLAQDAPADAAIVDAPTDAAPADLGVVDAPTADALRVDAGAPDAGAPEAGARTTLRVRYTPGAAGLALRGSVTPLNWDRGVTFRRVADDTWEWTADDLRAPFEWKPLLGDMTWSRGPNYRATPGATVVVFPHFVQTAGAFSRAYPAFQSTVLGNRRGVWVYLPPTYRENNSARFPVVYMHDGQNLFDPAAAFGGVAWDADGAMDGGAESGAMREAIIVGVENNASRIDEYTPTRDASEGAGGRGDLYVRMLVEEVKPMIDREYRTLPGPESTAVVGSSLGGLISLYAGVRRPDVFGLVGALSPSTWWDGRMILREAASLAARSPRPLRIYVDSGDAGPSNDDVVNTRELAATLRTAGYAEGSTLRYAVQAGAQHSERYWATRLPGAFAFLLGPRDP